MQSMENHHAINGKIHYFDWAIFNSYVRHYQRVVGHTTVALPGLHSNLWSGSAFTIEKTGKKVVKKNWSLKSHSGSHEKLKVSKTMVDW